MKTNKLNAENLKRELWQALQEVRAGTITPQQGEAIARHSREIIRVHMAQLTTREQLAVATDEMAQFVAEGPSSD